jgi:citrate lyase subunit beta/citryl-CoA lyase
MTPKLRLRSALYLPASNARAIEKSRTIAADAVIFDLEDSVAPSAKATARAQLAEAFKQGGFDKTTVIRCNAVESPDYLRDLDTISECLPDAVLIPKVSDVGAVETFESDAINRGVAGKFATWYMIETVAGLMNLKEIVQRGINTRCPLRCLVLGHNDLAVETGVSLGNQRQYLIPWLMQAVLCARHFDLSILDSVYNDHRDLEGFEAEVSQTKAMGFDGKSLIHPAQVEITNRVLRPGEAELAECRCRCDQY